jgi:spore germination protein GerM
VGIGLVKNVYEEKGTASGMKISSLLRSVNKNINYTQTVRLFYPNSDEKVNEVNNTLSFRTGEDVKAKLEQQFLQPPQENDLPLMSEGAKLNQLSLDAEGVLIADFSSEFIINMNLGSGYEQLVLQCLVDTLGGYYGVSKVCITIDGKPYESGHIIMDAKETMEVTR